MTEKELYDGIEEYLKERIDLYEERLAIAYHKMDKYRCPLNHADESLCNDIEDALDDLKEDYLYSRY